MGRIEYDVIEDQDARDAADVNSIWTAVETESSLLDQENFAEEGFDHRSVPANPVGETLQIISETTRAAATIAIAAVYAQFAFSGTTFRTTVGLPDLTADEAYRVRFRCWYESTIASGVGLTVGLRHRIYWNGGAGTQSLPLSERRFGIIAGSTVNFDATVSCEGWLFGAQSPVNWFEVQYLMGAGAAFPSKAAFWVTKFNRMNKV